MKEIYTIKDKTHTIQLLNEDGGYSVTLDMTLGGSMRRNFKEFEDAHMFFDDLVKGIYGDIEG